MLFVFDFVRRERLYCLTLVLILSVWVFLQPQRADIRDNVPPALQQLEAAAQNAEKAFEEPAAWAAALANNPTAVLLWFAAAAAGTLIFSGGTVFLFMLFMWPRLRAWFFEKRETGALPRRPVILLRVAVLTAQGVLLSICLTGMLGSILNFPEEAWALLQTLFIDIWACLSVFAVMAGEGMSWESFLGRPAAGYYREIRMGAAGYLAAFPIFVVCVAGLMLAAKWLHYEPPPHPLVQIFAQEDTGFAWVFYLALMMAAFCAPILEEIFFRGFLYRYMRGWASAPAAALISSGCFALMHGSGFAFLPILGLGLALTALYEYRGHLAASWTFHVLHNSLLTAYFFIVKALIEALPR